ncbi:hypothetical protein [Luteimonas sp. FCS-9]|uniref:hypothetical protein n=1 Tax=Luteimonas sp. FCS-9 TaxID=1547516 RepID=UPI0012E060AC|nr:hypothetical protein [Luteimonas sp. FCS-9]
MTPADVAQWYAHDAIAGLDGLTAEELVACGRGGEVVHFLLGVLASEGIDACAVGPPARVATTCASAHDREAPRGRRARSASP